MFGKSKEISMFYLSDFCLLESTACATAKCCWRIYFFSVNKCYRFKIALLGVEKVPSVTSGNTNENFTLIFLSEINSELVVRMRCSKRMTVYV